MLMYVCLPFIDVPYTACVFIISQLPDDGHHRWPKHAGTQKLNFEEKLEILLVNRNYIFLKNSTFFGSSLKFPPSELADLEKSFDDL